MVAEVHVGEGAPEIPATMRASVLVEPGRIVSQERRTPSPGTGEVLVRVAAVGVCGSDVHYYQHGRIGPYEVREPLVLGHEASGVVAATGAGVDPHLRGTRVSLEPQAPRPYSAQTLAGRYNLDPEVRFFATPPVDGAFCEYVTLPAPFAHALPPEVSLEDGALLEPLSVAVAAMEKGQVGMGSDVLVAGAGPIGIMIVQAALAYGARHVVVSEPDPYRRQQALHFGASLALQPGTALPDQGDVFFDAAGVESAVYDGLHFLRPGGRAVLVGMGADEMRLPVGVLQNHELVLTSVFRYANTWPTAIELVRSGRVELDGMVTARFPLDRAEEALRVSTAPEQLKVLVKPG